MTAPLAGGASQAAAGDSGAVACESPESVSLGMLPFLPSMLPSASSPGVQPARQAQNTRHG